MADVRQQNTVATVSAIIEKTLSAAIPIVDLTLYRSAVINTVILPMEKHAIPAEKTVDLVKRHVIAHQPFQTDTVMKVEMGRPDARVTGVERNGELYGATSQLVYGIHPGLIARHKDTHLKRYT